MNVDTVDVIEGTSSNPIVICDDFSSPVKILDGDWFSFVSDEDEGNEDHENEEGSPSDKEVLTNESGENTSVERNSQGLPIFEFLPPKYSANQIMQILLDPKLDTSLVASGRPIQVDSSTCCSTFVVDISTLKHPNDVKKDMYGQWDYSGSHPEVYMCSFDDFGDVSIERYAPGASGPNIYYLRRLRSCHPSNIVILGG